MSANLPNAEALDHAQVHLETHTTGAAPDAAPTVIFTHGWVDTRASWDSVVEAVGDAAHCITWDLRGHGDSEVPPPGAYTRDHALLDLERVVALAREGSDGPVYLAGHSLGGYLSLAHALNHPDDVAGLILVAAGPGFRKDETRNQWNESVDASAKKLGVPPGTEEISKHVDAWVIDNLASITAPTLVLVGEFDKRFQASAAVFEKNMDVRASVQIPDAGHAVHRKQGPRVAQAIVAFLDEAAD